jgi:GT2 family glycosyltransferase
MGEVQITVLLATRNRAQTLNRALDGYRRIVAPPVAWKLVVVDNGSTDRTPNIVRSAKRALPVELLTESRAGKNRALNRGLDALDGRLVIITDDDAVPDPSFLTAWTKYLECEPRFGLFGGTIMPLFDVSPPKWLIRSHHWSSMMFAKRDLPEGQVEADAIYGPNMAVRKCVFDAGFRFDETVGPNALDPDYPTGSETEFCCRVARSGVQCWSASEPLVSHIVSADQISLGALERRAYRTGRGRARQMWELGKIVTPPAPSPWQRLSMLSPFARRRFESRCAYHVWRGFEDECARMSHAQRASHHSRKFQ